MAEETPKLEFKPKFVDRYSDLTDWKAFEKICTDYLRRSIRVNTLKISVADLKKRMKSWNLKQVPWCKEGFWIEHKEGRRDIGNTIEHSLGYIYVQEAASMIPPVVLGAKPGERILDLCASPGSKTTQIAAMMKNKGLLVANDISSERMKSLGINLERFGVMNTIITMMKGQYLKDKGLLFDRILVDAPCSGTGTIRKSYKTLKMWNPTMVRRLSALQKQLAETAYSMLKPGGTMVYSTCSCEPEEDEGVVSHILKKFPDLKIQNILLEIKRSPPVLEFEGEKYHPDVKKALRIWPQDNDTEGFFVAKFKKADK
ncbi:NOL1/NOP2/sun family putative RNA methylase [Candidatus Woesearchaeota archaeon]|nr:NOL1/NOP2/sun family putative RNA methylase [Candidatus Woesearchaeota archaeon]